MTASPRHKLTACAGVLLGIGVAWADAERAARATGGVVEAATQLIFEGAQEPGRPLVAPVGQEGHWVLSWAGSCHATLPGHARGCTTFDKLQLLSREKWPRATGGVVEAATQRIFGGARGSQGARMADRELHLWFRRGIGYRAGLAIAMRHSWPRARCTAFFSEIRCTFSERAKYISLVPRKCCMTTASPAQLLMPLLTPLRHSYRPDDGKGQSHVGQHGCQAAGHAGSVGATCMAAVLLDELLTFYFIGKIAVTEWFRRGTSNRAGLALAMRHSLAASEMCCMKGPIHSFTIIVPNRKALCCAWTAQVLSTTARKALSGVCLPVLCAYYLRMPSSPVMVHTPPVLPPPSAVRRMRGWHTWSK